MYTNDLPTITDTNIIMYADDTCILTPVNLKKQKQNKINIQSTITQIIDNKLHVIYRWLSANKLSLNVSKTKCMLFHYKQTQLKNDELPNIQINNTPLEFTQNFKFLGINIDNTLSWNSHINDISNKISKVNGVLSKLKSFFPTFILTSLYNSLILSRLSYGLLVWFYGNCDRLKVLQKKAIRNIFKAPYNSHTTPICKSLKILYLTTFST